MLKSFKFARVKLFEFSTSRKTNNRLNTLKILTKDKLETINKTVSKTDDILSDKVNVCKIILKFVKSPFTNSADLV